MRGLRRTIKHPNRCPISTQRLTEHGYFRAYSYIFRRAYDPGYIYCPEVWDVVRYVIFECPLQKGQKRDKKYPEKKIKARRYNGNYLCNPAIGHIKNIVLKGNIISRSMQLRRTWLKVVEKYWNLRKTMRERLRRQQGKVWCSQEREGGTEG